MNEIRKRYPGEKITYTTRAIANSIVDKKGLYERIFEVFANSEEPMSAKDIAINLFKKNLLPTDSRQEVAPRITEMCQKGWLEPYGEKKRDNYSGISVTVYIKRKTMKEFLEEIKN